jgi:hypothetical protein
VRKLLIATCLSSVLAVMWRLFFGAEHISYKDFILGIPAIASAIGIATQSNSAKSFRLDPSFRGGLFGGLIGGGFAGLFIGVVYFIQFSPVDQTITPTIIPEVFGYGSVSGLLLGSSTQLIILWFRYLVTERQYPWLVFNDASGGLVGGAIGGIPAGGLGGLVFGFLHEKVVETIPLVTGSVLGAIFVAACTLFYEYRGLWRNVMRAFLISLFITAWTATVGIIIVQHLDLTAWFFSGTTSTRMMEGGAILGIAVGMISGIQIGLTLSFSRLGETMQG